MQQPTGPNSAAPTFWQVVLGTMLGNLGCMIVYLVLMVCVLAVFGTAILSRLQNISPNFPNSIP